jgi:hypothetical protein
MRAWPLLVVLLAAPAAALAQESEKPAPRIEYEKRTVINFEDDTIEGDLKRPDGEYLEARRRVSHSNLIQIREDWREKVMQASDEL